MSSHQGLAKGRLPDFFIVGAPKCGTTAMYDYLRQHPQVFMPFHKEPLFFGADLTRRYGHMSESEYRSLFTGADPGQRVGEASAWYLYSTSAAREIKSACPSAAIIIMLRNPVDVMHAQHSQLLYSHQESITDFEEALAAEADRAEGRCLPPGPIRRENLLYRRMVGFAEQVERYLDTFGRAAVHTIIFDDLMADTAAEYRRVLEFLHVDPDAAVDLRPSNENKRARWSWLQRIVWDPPLLRPLIPRLRRYPFVHRVRAAVLRVNSQRETRSALDPKLRARLVAELEPGIERLGEVVGRDLRHWLA